MKVAREDASTAGALIERKAELLRLADRCESEEPTYALDCKIEHLCEPERAQAICNARPYTTSIDAAVMIVPKGFAWSAQGDVRGDASVDKWGEISEQGRAATPALALCAAALRARAQEIA